jgi:hypothetical protein
MVVFTEGAERLAKRQTSIADVLLEAIDQKLTQMPGESVVDNIVKHGSSFIVLYTFTTRGSVHSEKRCASFRFISAHDGYRMYFNMIVE